MDLKAGALLASELVLSKEKHQDYPRTVTLERLYRALTTGEDIQYLMKRFDPREDEKAFEQAVRICQQTAPATVSTLMNPIRKLAQVRPVIDEITYEPKNETKENELKGIFDRFQGVNSLDHYISGLIDPGEIDPNSFELFVFDPFDARFTKPQPYAVHVSCHDAWNYRYFNGELEYFLLHRAIKYPNEAPKPPDPITGVVPKPAMSDGHRWVMYLDNHHIVFDQVRSDGTPGQKTGVYLDINGEPIDPGTAKFGDQYYFKASSNEVYLVTFYDQQSGRVPLIRLGAKPDAVTNGRTYVNIWHAAVPYLLKNVKAVREMDLTVALHVFPQKREYVRTCPEVTCKGGQDPAGMDCKTCKGSGYLSIGTAQDHVTLPLPAHKDDIIVPLAEQVHYHAPPADIVKELREIVAENDKSAIRAVYGTDMFTKDQVQATATAKLMEQQTAYDAMQPRVRHREYAKPAIVHLVANYLDSGTGLKVTYVMPQNLKHESAGDVVEFMGEALKSGASAPIMQALNYDLIGRVYGDDPEARKRAETMERFNPFAGKAEATITALIAGGSTSERSGILWTEMPSIFDEAELQFDGKTPGFYDLPYPRQRKVIDAIVDRMLKEKEEKAQKAMEQQQRSISQLGMEDGADPNDLEEQTTEPVTATNEA